MADVLRLTTAVSPTTHDRESNEAGPLAVDAKGLARLLSCGERTVHSWKSAGGFRPHSSSGAGCSGGSRKSASGSRPAPRP